MPGGIGDTAPGGGLAIVAVLAIGMFLIGVMVIAAQSSALRKRLDKACGIDPAPGAEGAASTTADGSADPSEPHSRLIMTGWPGFDPGFYGAPDDVDQDGVPDA